MVWKYAVIFSLLVPSVAFLLYGTVYACLLLGLHVKEMSNSNLLGFAAFSLPILSAVGGMIGWLYAKEKIQPGMRK